MRIATWNVERLRHHRDLTEIIEACNQAKADILILTEADSRVELDYPYAYHTPLLAEILPTYYRPTENRVSIFSQYPCLRQYQTFDRYTAICVELDTEKGSLLVYGTIMGIYGNRHDSFKRDLSMQVDDFKRLVAEKKNLCIAGDYNLSFSDNYYYTKDGRAVLLDCFDQTGIRILTAKRRWCIDHIAVSGQLVSGESEQIEEWNEDKRLSDHKGIVIEI